MANIKSAKKRILVSERNAERNKAIKSGALTDATKTIDMATSKGVYHKNTSSRKVSRMSKAVNKMA